LKWRGDGAALRAIKEIHIPMLAVHRHNQDLGLSGTQHAHRHSITKDYFVGCFA
jgi:hypothetical protein